MSKGIALLNRTVGSIVSHVFIEIIFFSVEKIGNIAGLVIELKDERKYFLGCGGDGGIFVLMKGKKEVGAAPGYARVERPIDGLEGVLSAVLPNKNSLILKIGTHCLEVKNIDDEMELHLDNKVLRREALGR